MDLDVVGVRCTKSHGMWSLWCGVTPVIHLKILTEELLPALEKVVGEEK